MSKLNLILHCGARSVEREEIDKVQTPECTDTWHPIPHKTLLDLVTERLPDFGLNVVNQAHGLFGDAGERMFSLMEVAAGGVEADDFGLVVGLRNSHDKTFPAGLCVGNGVFVCDNLSFSAEIVVGRRHTKNILRDLPEAVTRAIGKLTEARVLQAERLDAYKNTAIDDKRAHDLICKMWRNKAINQGRISKVIDQWHEPAHEEFAEALNVWRLFNGVTETFKPAPDSRRPGLSDLPLRTTRLHGVLDAACGITEQIQTKVSEAFADNPEMIVRD